MPCFLWQFVLLFPLPAYATRTSQLKIWHFWVIGTERNVCWCTFNSDSVITQFAKLAAGEQLCRRCTHKKLIALQTLQKILQKNSIFWVVTLSSQMSDILIQDKAACFGYKRTAIIRPKLPYTKEFNFLINCLYYTSFFKMFSPLKTKRRLLYLKNQSVRRSKHLISVIKTNQSIV
jgi:hypothetical protein